MPLLYGEGSKASARLQEEIIRQATDHTIFVWSPQSTAELIHILAPSARCFQRSEEVVRLHRVLESPIEMTNAGLRARLPLLTTSDGRSWIVLNCRYGDDFTGQIGLPIVLRQSSEQASGPPDDKLLYARFARSLIDGPKSHIEPYPVFTPEQLEEARMRDVLITGMSENLAGERLRNHSTRYTWFRPNALFRDRFYQDAIHPSQQWIKNNDYAIQWRGAWDWQTEYSHGYIVWSSSDSSSWLYALCACWYDSDGQEMDTYTIMVQEASTKPTHESLLESLFHKDAPEWLSVSVSAMAWSENAYATQAVLKQGAIAAPTALRNGDHLELSMAVKWVMGDLMCIMDLNYVKTTK